MEDNNNTTKTEEFCTMCRRGSSIAGDMFHLPGGINMCSDCMRKSLDQMSSLGVGDVLGGSIPGMQFTVTKEEVKPVEKVTGGMSVPEKRRNRKRSLKGMKRARAQRRTDQRTAIPTGGSSGYPGYSS